jgi:predicted nuclease of predicted toxin-antitoxin system
VRFLIDADLSPQLRLLFAEFGHDAIHAGNVNLGTAPDQDIAVFARDTGRCIITGDFDFANLLEYEPRKFGGIVVLTLPRNSLPPYISRLVIEFLERLPTLTPLNGKLLIVEIGRIRVRT